MTLAVVFLIAAITVPFARGNLLRLGDVRLRRVGLAFAALTLQVLIVTVFPSGSHGIHAAAHVFSYVLVAGFVVSNLSVPWMWLMATGGALNAAAIFANGGVMPADPDALAAAGMADPEVFTNSAAVENPRLGFLGDVFAVPENWPVSNVFSIGDALMVCGAFLALHAICGSRLALSRPSLEPA